MVNSFILPNFLSYSYCLQCNDGHDLSCSLINNMVGFASHIVQLIHRSTRICCLAIVFLSDAAFSLTISDGWGQCTTVQNTAGSLVLEARRHECITPTLHHWHLVLQPVTLETAVLVWNYGCQLSGFDPKSPGFDVWCPVSGFSASISGLWFVKQTEAKICCLK